METENSFEKIQFLDYNEFVPFAGSWIPDVKIRKDIAAAINAVIDAGIYRYYFVGVYMFEQLLQSGVFGVSFVLSLYIIYKNRKFLKEYYIYRLKTSTKVVVYIVTVIIIAMLMMYLKSINVHWILYKTCNAFCAALNVFLVVSIV